MVDITSKFEQIVNMIELGEYFAINRPRQYGKTTMLSRIARELRQQKDKVILSRMSFAGVGDTIFKDEESFCPRFTRMLVDSLEIFYPETAEMILEMGHNITNLSTLSKFITKFIKKVDLDVVLLIDEVDKSSNNQLFVSFLAMLRDKYLERNDGEDLTFKSVILAGVHDVKSLKLKLRDGEEVKLNSPWNIAADFNVDMSFNPTEIKTMLDDYAKDKGVEMNFDALAKRIHYYTSGYPFLVSKLCKNIDEEEAGQNPDYNPKQWTLEDIDWSFRWLTRESYTTTNFDDLAKNLENNPELYDTTYQVVFGTQKSGVPFSMLEPVIGLGVLYGIFAEANGKVKIHNLVYEQIITNYIRAKSFITEKYEDAEISIDYYKDGELQIDVVLLKFKEFMKEHYSDKDARFLEREGRLVFLSFLKPIVNGRGFMWKEPVAGNERRMDIVVTFGKNQKEVIELKIWRGEEYHKRGLQQLGNYLDFQGIKTGYLLIFDFNKNKEYMSRQIDFADKKIFAVYV